MEKENEIKINKVSIETISKKQPIKKTTHVPTACIHCKNAHLACDLSRPCKRCVHLGKSYSCIDIKHKKRGRPKLTTTTKKWQSSSTINNHYHTFSPIKNPTIPASSFKLTQQQIKEPEKPSLETMTLFLSMDLCCARTSDESIQFLQKDPKDLDYCSFYNLIDSSISDTISNIHRVLLDNCHQNVSQPISFLPVSSPLFLHYSPFDLLTIANGSPTLKCQIKFKSNPLDSFQCQFYLGGGLGGDLFNSIQLSQMYIVCLISKDTVSAPVTSPSLCAPFTPPPMTNTTLFQQQNFNDIFNSLSKFDEYSLHDLLFSDTTSF